MGLLTINVLDYEPGFSFTATFNGGVQIETSPTFRKPKHQTKIYKKFCGFSQIYFMEFCEEYDSLLDYIL